jgi:hypothetical protein
MGINGLYTYLSDKVGFVDNDMAGNGVMRDNRICTWGVIKNTRIIHRDMCNEEI